MYEVLEDLAADAPGNYGERAFAAGDLVYKFTGNTYGIISDDGVAVSYTGCKKPPCYELPRNKVRELP